MPGITADPGCLKDDFEDLMRRLKATIHAAARDYLSDNDFEDYLATGEGDEDIKALVAIDALTKYADKQGHELWLVAADERTW